jgi:hypothetical protein
LSKNILIRTLNFQNQEQVSWVDEQIAQTIIPLNTLELPGDNVDYGITSKGQQQKTRFCVDIRGSINNRDHENDEPLMSLVK